MYLEKIGYSAVKINFFALLVRAVTLILDLVAQFLIWIKWPVGFLLILLGLYTGWSGISFTYDCLRDVNSVHSRNILDDIKNVASIKWKNNPAQDGGPGFLFPTYERSSGRSSSQMSCSGLSKTNAYMSVLIFFFISFLSISLSIIVVKLPNFLKSSKILAKTIFFLSFAIFSFGPRLGESNKMPWDLYFFYLPLLIGVYFFFYYVCRTYLRNSRVVKP